MQAYFEDYLLNLQELHDDIISNLKNLPPTALDWCPAEDMNSINVLVTHIVGSERYWIGEVAAGDPAHRDRDAEFQVRGLDLSTLVQRLSGSLDYVRSKFESITLENLATLHDLLRGKRSTAWVLGHVLKHTGIHVGHIQLMCQLWELYGNRAD